MPAALSEAGVIRSVAVGIVAGWLRLNFPPAGELIGEPVHEERR